VQDQLKATLTRQATYATGEKLTECIFYYTVQTREGQTFSYVYNEFRREF